MLTPIRRVKRREPIETPEPETPSKRVRNEKVPLTPPHTPNTAYSTAKTLFQRGSRSRTFVGRNGEYQQINEFILSRLDKSPGALYISGVPGTGKSALVGKVLAEHKTAKRAQINCMTVERPDHIYSTILGAFGYATHSSSKGRAIEELKHKFTESRTSHVLMLDEIDHIMQGDQEVLFQLFEWSCKQDTNLILIGVANSLDLTDRFLPRLQAHELRPKVLSVKPYTQEEIIAILEGQLMDFPDMFRPEVLRLFAAKVAAQSGDLRKAFDLCGRAIQHVEEEQLMQLDLSGNAFENHKPVPVTMKHAVQVCQEAFGGESAAARIRRLNYIQCCVLCTMLIEEVRSQSRSSQTITVGDLLNSYTAFQNKEPSWVMLDLQDFIQIVSALEAAGLVFISGLCGKRGLGSSAPQRKSHGGSGAGSSRSIEGRQSSFSLRRIRTNIQTIDALSGVTHETLKRLLLDHL